MKNGKLTSNMNVSKVCPKRLLTVCYGNLHRSRTAEWLLHKNYTVDSCGIWWGAVQPIQSRQVEFADKIIVMEQFMANETINRYPKAKDKITILDVEDNYICPKLIQELKTKLDAKGFKTLNITNYNKAMQQCRMWVDQKIFAKFTPPNSKINTDNFSPISKESS